MMATRPLQQLHPALAGRPASSSQHDSTSSEASSREDDSPEDLEFLEGEGLRPGRPEFIGLFRPSLFKSLLHKAKVMTNTGVVEDPQVQRQEMAFPNDDLFLIPKTE